MLIQQQGPPSYSRREIVINGQHSSFSGHVYSFAITALKEGRYLVSGLDNRRNPPVFSEDADPRDFSPNALAYYIR